MGVELSPTPGRGRGERRVTGTADTAIRKEKRFSREAKSIREVRRVPIKDGVRKHPEKAGCTEKGRERTRERSQAARGGKALGLRASRGRAVSSVPTSRRVISLPVYVSVCVDGWGRGKPKNRRSIYTENRQSNRGRAKLGGVLFEGEKADLSSWPLEASTAARPRRDWDCRTCKTRGG